MKKAEPEYKWQAPQTEKLASEGQVQFPQMVKRMIPQPNPQTGKKPWGPGQPHSPFGITLLKEHALDPRKNPE